MPNHPNADPHDASSGILDIMHDTFDYAAHRVTGSADEAIGWVGHSSLPKEDKTALRVFVERFPGITFYRDDEVLLDHVERRNAITLPPWLRQVRQVLSGPGPDVQVRFDEFDHWNPRADHTEGDDDGVINLWYMDRFLGYLQDEEHNLLRNGAECYPILGSETGVNYLLAANLGTPDDANIFDLCDEDIMDACHAGTSGTGYVFPAFTSYASMLSHIVECLTEDGTVIRARGLS